MKMVQGRKSDGPRYQIFLDGGYVKTVYTEAEYGNIVYEALSKGEADRAYVNKVERVAEYETRQPASVTVVERREESDGSESPIHQDQEVQEVDW